MSAIRVRVEAAADSEAIRAVQEQAFGQRDEAAVRKDRLLIN